MFSITNSIIWFAIIHLCNMWPFDILYNVIAKI